jgi:site-specific recombinase XerD
LPAHLQEYAEYRVRHHGVAQSTLPRDVDVATQFLSALRLSGRSLSTARVSDLDDFVAGLARRMSARTVAGLCSSLRAFLRFEHATGRLRRDLAASVVAPRVRRDARPPRALPWKDVRRMLRLVDLVRPRGRRDFAALLMMASYGMGAAELCALRLEDIDWNGGVLRIRRAKTGVEIELPLMPAVARAIAAYLRNERPQHALAREVFVASQLPHTALTGAAVRHLVRKHARRAGITAEILGAHVLRHSHATGQIDLSAPPKIVGVTSSDIGIRPRSRRTSGLPPDV